jgi:alpha/beta superfamily hydrolase
MVAEETVRFPSGDVMLVGGLTSSGRKSPGVVICHPHPEYGGSMHNNVVQAVMAAVLPLGYSTLRFNFRGVGGSGGYSEGTLEDSRDVAAALDLVQNRGDFDPLYLVGYSYGAWVGLHHTMSDSRIKGWAGISPPVNMFDFSFLKKGTGEKLIAAGDRDMFCDLGVLKGVFEKLGEPKKFVTISGADHFYVGYEGDLAKVVSEFFRGIEGRD